MFVSGMQNIEISRIEGENELQCQISSSNTSFTTACLVKTKTKKHKSNLADKKSVKDDLPEKRRRYTDTASVAYTHFSINK